MITATNHVGLCVTDIDRSRRFYEGLGFEHDYDLRPPDDMTAPLLGIEAPGLRVSYLKMGTFVLELLQYERPDNPDARPRPLNEPGLTHLSLTVDDVPATLALAAALGGEVIESSNIGFAVMVRDPDGQVLEFLPSKGL